MNKSESIKEIANALCNAQSAMGGVKKSNTVSAGSFSYNYADLASVIEVLREPFANNGLSYAQAPIYQDGKAGVETLLMHESGEYLSSILLLPMTKNDPQAAGSAISYARRYSLQSLSGLPSEDDDSISAMPQQPQQTNAPTADDKAWYSDQNFNDQKDAMLAKLQSGEQTTDGIVSALRNKYKVSKAMAAKIKELK